jgi:tetratricopeptide (TPR) repeat protein
MAADRYSYLAVLPFTALVAAWLARVGPRAFAPVLLVVVALGVGTYRQTHVWRDSGTLWERAIAHDADNWFALCNRGAWSEERGRYAEALADYDRTLELNPDYHIALCNRGQVRFQLARRAFDQGDRETAGELLAGARDDFTAAIAIHAGYGKAFNGRGVLRAETGDPDGARNDFDEAIARKPLLYEAWNNRGNLRNQQGDLAGAIADLRKSIEINPISPDIMFNLADALLRQGTPGEAAEHLERALAQAPADWRQRAAAEAKLRVARSGG